MSPDEKYIVLDARSYDYYNYQIKLDGDNLVLSGSYNSIKKAGEVFINSLFEGGVRITDADAEGELDRLATPYDTKEELLAIYQYAMSQNKTIFGEHLAGYHRLAERVEQFYAEVGDRPAIMDYDLLNNYANPGNYYPKTEISRIVCEIVEYAAKGGIVTTMCHWLNPNVDLREEGYRGKIGPKENWDLVMTDNGNELNRRFKEQLNYDAEVFLALQKAGVPVTFRPMHEANGSWFWFCAYQGSYTLTKDDMLKMWNYVRDYYESLGINNILWTYSPNVNMPEYNLPTTDYYYPGEDGCDLVGMDGYGGISYGEEGYNFATNTGYGTLQSYNKPVGFCEWGRGNDGKGEVDWTWQDFVNMLVKLKNEGNKFAFFETYAGGHSVRGIEGGEILNQTSFILLLDDMPAFIAKALEK